jgi:hypothetical protein
MEPDLGSGLYDADLDTPRPPVVVLRDEVEHYQQVVINPLLTVLSWLVMYTLSRPPFSRWLVIPPEVAFMVCFLSLALLQFHCLDCGRTGWLMGRQRHACGGLLARRKSGTPGWQVFAPEVQARICLGLLAMAAILFACAFD